MEGKLLRTAVAAGILGISGATFAAEVTINFSGMVPATCRFTFDFAGTAPGENSFSEGCVDAVLTVATDIVWQDYGELLIGKKASKVGSVYTFSDLLNLLTDSSGSSHHEKVIVVTLTPP